MNTIIRFFIKSFQTRLKTGLLNNKISVFTQTIYRKHYKFAVESFNL